ncbi:MAG: G8 domain-containing protein [Parvularculaceae bacterium]
MRLSKIAVAAVPELVNPELLGRPAAAPSAGRRRRGGGRAAELKRGAGVSVLAAMIGAQIAEDALAGADDHRGALDRLLAHGRVCTGRFSAEARGPMDDDPGASVAIADLQHANHAAGAGRAPLAPDPVDEFRLSADDSPFIGRGHFHFADAGGRSFTPPRGRGVPGRTIETEDEGHAGAGHSPPGTGGGIGPVEEPGPRNETPTDDTAGGGHSGGSHQPQPGGGTGSDAPTGGATGGATGGNAGGHHDDPRGAPASLDAAMRADHAAILALAPVSSATHVAVKNGSWFDPATWAGGEVPGEGARVLIPAGVTVAYDGESPASIKTVRIDGALDFATDRDTFLEVDTVIVTDSGALTIGTRDDPVDADVRAVIQFADNGPIDVSWDPRLLSRGLVSLGSIDINGAEKASFLKVAVDPMKGDTTLTLEGPPEGWRVGDRLVLTGTHLVSTGKTPQGQPIDVATEDEELVIVKIEGNVITFDKPLQYDHEGPRADLKAYVANYSRNIVFETENADAVPVHQRGHVMLMHSNDVTVRFAEFTELGRTDKSERAFDLSDLHTVEFDSNVKGRYSLHIHRSGVDDQAHPVIVEGASVWGAPGWGFVHHDSNAIFADNAAYDVFGAAFVAETGNETGRWSGNIAIKSLGVDHIVKNGDDVNAFDLGRTGTGFWFQGRLVEAVGNVAAGIPSGAGFTYFHRGPDSKLIPVDPSVVDQADSLRYLDRVDPNIPAISIFTDNETIASERGLEVIKANPRQGHGVRSVIDDFTAWEVETGVHLQYTAHYTITGLDVVATDAAGRSLARTRGVVLDNNVIDVVINGASIDGFAIGVDQVKNAKNDLAFIGASGRFEYVYVDVDIAGARVDFTNRTRHDLFLDGDDLAQGRLSLDGPAQFAFRAGRAELAGEIIDSIGARALSPAWDSSAIGATELRGAIAANGVWTTPDGRRVTLIEEYIADRATGVLDKVGLFVEIPPRFRLPENWTDNGELDVDSRSPVAGADFASVKAGQSVTIDVLANDRDPDGDQIRLDGLFSERGRIVANDDGTVTYFADPGFDGVDKFYYFVQDANGDITRAEVTVTVEI